MADLIQRSVAFTVDVDVALEALAADEGTSRADLVREGITRVFEARGLDIDAQADVVVNRNAVVQYRNRRREPVGDRAHREFAEWWSEHNVEASEKSSDPVLLGQIVDALLTFVNRDGLVDLTYRDRLLGPTASYGDRYRLEDLERELVEYGAIEFHRRRALPRQIRLAPWAR